MGSGLYCSQGFHAVKSNPHARDEIRSIPDKPGITEAVGGAGFPGQGTADEASAFPGSTLNHVHHHVRNQIGRLFGHDLIGFEHVLFQRPAFLIVDKGNGIRRQCQPLVCQHSIRRREFLQGDA